MQSGIDSMEEANLDNFDTGLASVNAVTNSQFQTARGMNT